MYICKIDNLNIEQYDTIWVCDKCLMLEKYNRRN